MKFLRDRMDKDELHEDEGVFNTIIGVGSSFRGTLMVDGTLRVDGDFDGDLLNCDRLEVGPHGCVRVDVHVREAIIEGQMHGSIQAEERVELLSGARMYGDLACRRVVIEDGVHFSGRCAMVEEGESLQGGAPTTMQSPAMATLPQDPHTEMDPNGPVEVASGYRREGF